MDRGQDFVPKGPSDSSLAVYCQECVLKKIRPVGNGMSWSTGAFTAQGRRTFLPTLIIPFPNGTDRFFPDPQAVNCKATIIQSPRDKSQS